MAPRRRGPHAPPAPGQETRYAEDAYWRERYAACAPGETFEWFLTYDSLAPLLSPWLRRGASVLDVGCGSSLLLADLRAAGHDASAAAAARLAGQERLQAVSARYAAAMKALKVS